MTDEASYPAPSHGDALKRLDAFFAVGGLTVYASTASSWRWLACAGDASLQARLIDPESLFELSAHEGAESTAPERPHQKNTKPFERSRLVRWLTHEASKTTDAAQGAPAYKLSPDEAAFARLLNLDYNEWSALGLKTPLNEAEIRYFNEAHNAALSDIESAFLPGKIDLPPTLASFYIRYLTKARRDVEATLIVAQSSSSTRIPFIMADALAVAAFEGASQDPLRSDGSDYAAAVANDTSAFIDAAIALAGKKLALPIDHANHLLRLNVMDITRLASEIVEQHRLAPFRFLLKAKELYLARCDVCRFPPLERLATSIAERDLNGEEPWVQRISLAYTRLFQGQAMPVLSTPRTAKGKILGFSRR